MGVGEEEDGEKEGNWELGVGGWGRRGWGDGGKEGNWELGVGGWGRRGWGKEGNWELGVGGWGRRGWGKEGNWELGVGGWGRRGWGDGGNGGKSVIVLLTSCIRRITRQGINSLANSESPLKRTKSLWGKDFSPF
uniref:Uncharacterized protein n=1 Tax=Desertifilum tharense IPPAS B-1220 TaxID=1781255 RepID=A0ACD5GVP8_9CYAN